VTSITKHKFSGLADKGWRGIKEQRVGGEAGPDLCISETSCRLGPHIIRGLCEAVSLLKKKKKLKACERNQIMIQKKLVKRYVCNVTFYVYPSTSIKKIVNLKFITVGGSLLNLTAYGPQHT